MPAGEWGEFCYAAREAKEQVKKLEERVAALERQLLELQTYVQLIGLHVRVPKGRGNAG